MGVKKISISLDENLAETASQAAEKAGLSLSAWLSEAVQERLRIHEGLRAMEELWEELGYPTEEERLNAEAKAAEVLDAIEQLRRRRRKRT